MTVARYHPPGVGPLLSGLRRLGGPITQVGHMITFFLRAVISVPTMLLHYKREFARVLSDVTWGNGSIVVGGGTAGVIIVLGATAGAIVGIEGYSALELLGMGPATGFISSFASTRELAPIMAALAFAAQAGCRFTAQLGAMRISEEIDAMEAIALRPIPYLVTTRLMASVVAVIPLYIVCLGVNYLVCQLVVSMSGAGSSGTYLHYFTLVLSGTDIAYSILKAVVFVSITTTIQCYYGYYASGGPQGVGVAAGRAMRTAITVMIIVNMLMTMALWGVNAGARFGG